MNYLDNNTRQLHLWYPLTALKEEISVRTAYLGKFRRTEETKHLLDLIHLTEDEERLMLSCFDNAMADLYEPLSKYARGLHVPTMVMNDGVENTIDIPKHTNVDVVNFTENTKHGNKDRILGPISVETNSDFDRDRYSLVLHLNVTYTTGYKIKGMSEYIPDETITKIVEIKTTNKDVNTYNCVLDMLVELKGETDSLTASEIIDHQVELYKVSLYAINPKSVQQYGWISYNGKIYQTIAAIDENDFLNEMVYKVTPNREYLLFPSDPRYSIRYLLTYPKELNMHYILPLDIALKEALVCHIIKEWLGYAYPDEVEVWEVKYAKALQNVYSRSNMQEKPITKLIPRWF